MRHRFITFLVFGAIIVGIGEWDLRNQKIEPLQKLNDFWLEFCVGNSRDKISDPAVTFIRINDEYEPQDLGLGAPTADPDAPKNLTQLDYAVTLGFLEKLNPKSIALVPTPEFDASLMVNQTAIEPLREAASKVPRMTLGSVVAASGNAIPAFRLPTALFRRFSCPVTASRLLNRGARLPLLCNRACTAN